MNRIFNFFFFGGGVVIFVTSPATPNFPPKARAVGPWVRSQVMSEGVRGVRVFVLALGLRPILADSPLGST